MACPFLNPAVRDYKSGDARQAIKSLVREDQNSGFQNAIWKAGQLALFV
jgi:hypothetical protein